eukprot:4120268-Pyramimonas_sp.AAC.1
MSAASGSFRAAQPRGSLIITPRKGIVRACADDAGAVFYSIQSLRRLHKVFQASARVAGLHLKPPKCFLVPLSGPCTPELREQ